MNKAMSRVDELTQRNATAAEEVASTSEELSSQAESLQSLIAFFRIGSTTYGDHGNHHGEPDVAPRTRKAPAQRPLAATTTAAPVMARRAVSQGNDTEFTRF